MIGTPTGGAAAQSTEHLTAELRILLHARQYNTAFEKALNTRNYQLVTWLCKEAGDSGLNDIFGQTCPLTQVCLLVLIQQLGWDLATDLKLKLQWMQSAAIYINPRDPSIQSYLRQTVESVVRSLGQAVANPANSPFIRDLRLLTVTLEKLVA